MKHRGRIVAASVSEWWLVRSLTLAATKTAAFLAASSALAAPASVPLEIPQLTDARLQITLYADAPDIVTPIGAAVDARGRLFVLESHTHLAPSGYAGPKRDRVLIFEGAGTDGRAARRSVFDDDILEGLNLSFAPDGTLYVITAKTVAALPDRDGDGRADETKIILRLETDQKYPHNQLLGLTVSADGWVYATRGNTGGDAYAWVAADGHRIPGYGEGGDIVRCRPDGTKLERVATGFWNPFDLKFDRTGRLLGVDNDPDSRGPNRLLHIVPGGDYGFKALYGASGLHPYDAWDGELSGTLPMIAGIGESPSGVLDLSFGALPAEYRDTIAATIWGEHHVAIVRPKASGASLRGTAGPFIRGGKWFRPVAIVAAPDGAIYLTDWVLKDYPNHGQGRIWKLTTRTGVATMSRPAAAATSRAETLENVTALRAALRDGDPFVRHSAEVALARSDRQVDARRELTSADPALRLGALLALRRAGADDAEAIIRAALRDADEPVRLTALRWAGEKELRGLLPEIDGAVAQASISPRLFETWLATMQILKAPALPAGAKRPAGFRIRREADPRLLEQIAADATRPASVRAFALRRVDGAEGVSLLHVTNVTSNRLTPSGANREPLVQLLSSLARERGDPALRIEALRTLAPLGHAGTPALLRTIATDRSEPARLRAEAIVALGTGAQGDLRPFLEDSDPAVRTQAARTLRAPAANAAKPPPPHATAEWIKTIATGGDAEAGERVFFAATSTCAQCHRVAGRGGSIGPDLSVIARTANREQLVRSIVEPSAEIAPQFQGWEIATKSGDVFSGLQGHWRTGGGASIILLDGRDKSIPAGQVASFRALESSLMPEGLAALFSVEELRDLVAHLEQLK